MLTDALGSTILATDATQATVTSYSYDAYGNTTQLGTNDNSQQYTGRENDGTGLYYYRARYYSPTWDRFVSQDPIGWNAGQTNRFSYVNGNPVSFIDPLGLDYQGQVGVSGGIFGPIIPGTVGPSVGVTGGTSVGISTDLTFCNTSVYVSFQANVLAGAGIYAGVGANVGVGKTDGHMASGSSTTPYGEVNVGIGPGGGVSGSTNSDGSFGGGSGYGGKIFGGAAVGAMAGGGASVTTNLASPTLGDALRKLGLKKICGCEK